MIISRHVFKCFVLLSMLVVPIELHATTSIKVATISPDGSAWMKALRRGGKEVETATEGRVQFKFYPGGIKGDDFTVLKLIRARQLHGGVVTTGVFNTIYTDAQLYNLPMQFQDLDQLDAVRQKLDPILMDGLEEAGFVTFGIAEVGSAYAMGKRAATSMQAARSLKIWTPDGDEAALRTLQAFGISPIPSPIANVLTGLQTGLFDTVTSPPVAAVALQWHTQVDYLLDMPLMYVYGLFVVSDRQFQKLSQIDQVTVRNIMGKVVKEVDKQNRSDHVATFDLLLDMGVERLEPSPQEREEWQQSADSAAQAWVDDGIITPAMYEILEKTLESDRATFDR